MIAVLLASLAVTIAGADYTPEALLDQVVNLPGAESLNVNFNQFSGYLNVSPTKHNHYWFVESMNDPANDPLTFWTNGGPGCSGLIGFLFEQGPFRPNKDLSLSLNEYSWNTISNMVFVEQPCGVGFSYSDEPDGGDYESDDTKATIDNYNMIQAFLTRFPQYRKNDLYYTSESYGGHYLPQLAKMIVDENKNATNTGNPVLNFKGFAVGNPFTTFYSGIPAGKETYWGHQIISKPTYEAFTKECTIPKLNIVNCALEMGKMYLEVGKLDCYALDYPVCTEEKGGHAASVRRHGRTQRTWFLNHVLGAMAEGRADGAALEVIRTHAHIAPLQSYEPCEEDYLTSYLNQPDVKAALHVKADFPWTECSYKLNFKNSEGLKDMTPYYNYLIDGGFGLNLLVFSGDDDDVCSTWGTQSWIWGLGYQAADKAWQDYTVNGQVGGYITKWANTKLAFATVHGAGHEVPAYKPDVALELFRMYLAGELTNT